MSNLNHKNNTVNRFIYSYYLLPKRPKFLQQPCPLLQWLHGKQQQQHGQLAAIAYMRGEREVVLCIPEALSNFQSMLT